jgi:very-short-patch-repair endonuclease
MAQLLNANGLVGYEREFHFAAKLGRDWRFDFAYPVYKIAVECEGSEYAAGRHTRGSGFTADCEKYNAAAALGWTVLRFPGHRIQKDTTRVLEEIKATFGLRDLGDDPRFAAERGVLLRAVTRKA